MFHHSRCDPALPHELEPVTLLFCLCGLFFGLLVFVFLCFVCFGVLVLFRFVLW